MAFYSSGFGSGFGSAYGSGGGYGSSTGKGQGSLLQAVIRKLVDSIDDEERTQHYEEIKTDLDVAEENMNTLVEEHQEKLHSTLSTFGKIDATIKDSQLRVRMLKENLAISRTQLHCKREALKRLYFDDVKHKLMLKLLDQVENMKRVPEQLQQYRIEKKYYEATELLKNAVSSLEKDLSKIEALRDLRVELTHLRDSFHDELIDELQHQLYTKPSGFAYKTTNPQVPQPLHHSRTPSNDSARLSPLALPKHSTKHIRHSSKTGVPDSTHLSPPPIIELTDETRSDQSNVSDDTQLTDEAAGYLGSLVDSLSMLGKVPEMLDAVQRKMTKELLLIIEKASIRISQMAKEEGVSPEMSPSAKSTNSTYLQTLLEMCFQQFEDVVATHSVLLKCLKKAKVTYKGSYDLYTEADVWTAIQQVTKDMLEVYLAVDDEKPQATMSAFTPFAIAGHDFVIFKKRVPTKARKQPLFRFDNSRHAISVSSYIKEQRDKELASQVKTGQLTPLEHNFEDNQPSITQHIVCKPTSHNITVIYSPVRDFALKVEDALQLQPDTHCELYRFLQTFVEHRFLDTIQVDLQEKMDNALKPEARDSVKPLRGSNRPALLTSSVILWDSLKELTQLMNDIPIYSSNFLSVALELVQAYIDICYTSFKESTTIAVPPVGGGGNAVPIKVTAVSAKWVHDEGIIRLLTSFHSWQRLKKCDSKEVEIVGKGSLYNRETENLLSSLSNDIKQRSNVIFDHDCIKLLCVLHESMEWLGEKLKEMIVQLSARWSEGTDGGFMSRHQHAHRRRSTYEQQIAHDNDQQTKEYIDLLSNCLEDIQSLSQTTIIVLHLEVRCHCFFYLLPTLRQSVYVCDHEVADADSGVKELGTDLTSLKMITAASLMSEKQGYLFDGLGHLIASIFISSTSYLKKININGVKKMCRNIQHIQSCLSKVTSIREKDLDLAQKYFAMLYVNEEEFLKLVMEQGRLFNEVDYVNALTLLYHSQSHTNPVRLDNNIKKLEQMFAEDAC